MSNSKFTDNSRQVLDALDDAKEKVLEEWGQVAEGYAKRLCPVDKGLLRNSITYAINGKSPAISEYTDNPKEQHGSYSGTVPSDDDKNKQSVYIGTNVEYAPYVELGTSRTRAQPYLKPAVADHAGEYEKIAKGILKGQ